ncbi:MAG: DEAD/DEAH box helicase family protein [Planctomycetes bacterium]|nr:DEAD/DEAH box helicase family protein [Planctomycetota bacterium]
MTLQLQYDSHQPFQLEAVQAVLDLFEGQPRNEPQYAPIQHRGFGGLYAGQSYDEGGVGNQLVLDDERLRANTREVQERNAIEVAAPTAPLSCWELLDVPADLRRRCPHFSVEMETGTGKTYVYLRTIRELARRYGFSKFVIVVPSVAIREGVLSSLRATWAHFRDLFENQPCEYSVYDAKDLNRVAQFARSPSLQILVINIDAFRKYVVEDEGASSKGNVIYKETDRLNGRAPIEFLQAARPIVIIDEPQSVDSTEKAQEAIQRLNPLCTLRYSATHRNAHELVYRLDPIRAFELGLVKKIVVASVTGGGAGNEPFVRVERVEYEKGLKAKLRIHKKGKDGPREGPVTVKYGDDLFLKSDELECYRHGFSVTEISAAPDDPERRFVKLGSRVLKEGEEIGGRRDDIWRVQIRETVQRHLDKELQLAGRGLKVLSLFFLDSVANYRVHGAEEPRGPFALAIEEILSEFAKDAKYRTLSWLSLPVHTLHDGYFAKDDKKGLKDSREGRETKDDESAFELIMQSKERLLGLDVPLRFLFSHSALREGWDNPNVFQICTLNATQSTQKKRQEIGRGLRLPVDQEGRRVRDEGVNRLSVIANESYEAFAKKLQGEYEQECGVTFGRIPLVALARLTREVDGKLQPIGRVEAQVLHEALVAGGMLDAGGRLLPAFRPEADGFALALPGSHADLAPAVVDLLQTYRLERHIQPESDKRVNRLRKEVQLGADFQALWERIQARTTYRVEFETAKLIDRAANAVRHMSPILPRKVDVKAAKLDVTRAGLKSQQIAAREEQPRYGTPFMPDILSYLQDRTELTRATLASILRKSGRLGDAFVDPQRFLDAVVAAISHEMHEVIVEGVRYEKLDPERPDAVWEMTRFESEELIDYLRAQEVEAKKGLYDYVLCDSQTERAFARGLNAREDIRLFVKLPRWFTVDTPVGTYNPDWAIVKEERTTLYLVRETKANRNLLDLRSSEARKAKCGKRHFDELGVDFKIAASADEV